MKRRYSPEQIVGKLREADVQLGKRLKVPQVCKHLGFENSGLEHINSSDKRSRELRRKVRNFLRRNGEDELRNYVDFYDTETRETVSKLYRADIENFGYSFADALKNR